MNVEATGTAAQLDAGQALVTFKNAYIRGAFLDPQDPAHYDLILRAVMSISKADGTILPVGIGFCAYSSTLPISVGVQLENIPAFNGKHATSTVTDDYDDGVRFVMTVPPKGSYSGKTVKILDCLEKLRAPQMYLAATANKKRLQDMYAINAGAHTGYIYDKTALYRMLLGLHARRVAPYADLTKEQLALRQVEYYLPDGSAQARRPGLVLPIGLVRSVAKLFSDIVCKRINRVGELNFRFSPTRGGTFVNTIRSHGVGSPGAVSRRADYIHNICVDFKIGYA